MAFYRIDPWGQERADLRAGVIASTVANCLSDKPWKPSDFIPKYGPQPEEKPRSAEDLKFAAQRINALFGGSFQK